MQELCGWICLGGRIVWCPSLPRLMRHDFGHPAAPPVTLIRQIPFILGPFL